jgi:Fe-S-cluster-containing dehydrogenase component
MESSCDLSNILAIDFGKCTGCRNCELACSARNAGTFNPSQSRIHILKDEMQNLILPIVCLQCENPLCEEACPNGAIVRNQHGILTVDSGICIGCQNCVISCIYGGIAIDPITHKAIKCDLCEGDPACVGACVYGAISLVSAELDGFRLRHKGIATATTHLSTKVEEVEG